MRVSESERVTCVQTADPERPENAESENEFISQYSTTQTSHAPHLTQAIDRAPVPVAQNNTHAFAPHSRQTSTLAHHSLSQK